MELLLLFIVLAVGIWFYQDWVHGREKKNASQSEREKKQ